MMKCEVCGATIDSGNPFEKPWTHSPGKYMHKRCYMNWLEHDINERYKQEGRVEMKRHNKHRKIEGLF